MKRTKKYQIVVGGGVAGILISYILKIKGHNVLLLEKDFKLGGLLNSKQINGRFYDHGTHLLRRTGIGFLDDFLFSGLDYYEYSYIKNGSFNKTLFDKNGFLSDFSLPKKTRLDCLNELIKNVHESDQKFKNLEEQLIASFGLGYYNELLKPVIKKLFFEDPLNLVIDSHLLFGLSRIIVAESSITDKLKKDVYLNQVIAYYSYSQGASKLTGLYPKNGGVEAWINLLETKIRKAGVEIELESEFHMELYNNEISNLSVNGRIYPVQNIYWTIPPIFLYHKIQLPKPFTKQPQRLSSIIIDMEYAGDLLTDLYYFQVFDPDFKSFRVTLYDNFDTFNDSGIKRITVEFLSKDDEIDLVYFSQCAKNEIQQMGIITDENKLLVVSAYTIKGGFPVPTAQFQNDSKQLIEGLNSISNLKLYGKATGKKWFMHDILFDIYNDLK